MQAGLTGLAAALLPAAAWGFVCTTTEKNDFVSIRWHTTPVAFAIRQGPTQVPATFAEQVVKDSFARWSAPRCTHMRFDYRGIVASDTELKEVSQVIFVQDGWPHARDAVGLTTMTYSTVDGRISFGKIEINEDLFRFGDTEVECATPGQQVFDLEAVLTHEVGHFIGLGHVGAAGDPPARGPGAPTMSPRVVDCDSGFRSLETDDQDGLCFIYPTGLRARSCDSLPPQSGPYVANVPFSCRTHGGGAWLGPVVLLLLGARRRAASRARACSPEGSAR